MEKIERVDWDVYLMGFAEHAALRSTCTRASVGAVIVKNHRVLCTGYVGSIAGTPHCVDVGCDCSAGDGCKRTVHAECNAILQAARYGISIEYTDIYTTLSPCMDCLKMIAGVGIKRIFFRDLYRKPEAVDLAAELGIDTFQVAMPALQK